MAPHGGQSLHRSQEGTSPARVFQDSFETTLLRLGRRARIHIGKPPVSPIRTHPNPIDEALALESKRRQHPSLSSLARAAGLTPARVSQLLGLLRLPPPVRDSVRRLNGRRRASRISERELRPIVVLGNPTAQLRAFKRLLVRKGLKE